MNWDWWHGKQRVVASCILCCGVLCASVGGVRPAPPEMARLAPLRLRPVEWQEALERSSAAQRLRKRNGPSPSPATPFIQFEPVPLAVGGGAARALVAVSLSWRSPLSPAKPETVLPPTQLWLVDLSGKPVRLVVEVAGEVVSAAFSPKGDRLAYIVAPVGEQAAYLAAFPNAGPAKNIDQSPTGDAFVVDIVVPLPKSRAPAQPQQVGSKVSSLGSLRFSLGGDRLRVFRRTGAGWGPAELPIPAPVTRASSARTSPASRRDSDQDGWEGFPMDLPGDISPDGLFAAGLSRGALAVYDRKRRQEHELEIDGPLFQADVQWAPDGQRLFAHVSGDPGFGKRPFHLVWDHRTGQMTMLEDLLAPLMPNGGNRPPDEEEPDPGAHIYAVDLFEAAWLPNTGPYAGGLLVHVRIRRELGSDLITSEELAALGRDQRILWALLDLRRGTVRELPQVKENLRWGHHRGERAVLWAPDGRHVFLDRGLLRLP